jgi:hypothetical protein
MRVKVGAVVLDGARLLVTREWRHGKEHLSLPGGRVKHCQPFLDLGSEPELPFLPPILDAIAQDAAAGWDATPRWLENVWKENAERAGSA